MQFSYSHTAQGSDFYRVRWFGRSMKAYIPTGLTDSVFKRSMLATGLSLVRAKVSNERAMHAEKVAAQISWENRLQSDFPTVAKLSDEGFVSFSPTKGGGLSIEDAHDYYYSTTLSKEEAQALVNELQRMVSELPESQESPQKEG